jgi:hypothetical protein
LPSATSDPARQAESTREFYLSLDKEQRELWLAHETRATRNRRAAGDAGTGGRAQGASTPVPSRTAP